MPTRNVVLTPHQDKLIDRLVSSGRYQNASEILREGLRLVERAAEEEKAKLAALRDAARLGVSDIEAGRFREFESFDALDRYLKKMTESAVNRS